MADFPFPPSGDIAEGGGDVGFKNFQEFTTSGQFITPEEITTIYIIGIGGGAGGGSGANSTSSSSSRRYLGGGGGGAGSITTVEYLAQPNTPITIVIGAGGVGGVTDSGQDRIITGTAGGDTVAYVGNEPLLDARGGSAGSYTSSNNAGTGGLGYSQAGFGNQVQGHSGGGSGLSGSATSSIGVNFQLFAGTGGRGAFSHIFPSGDTATGSGTGRAGGPGGTSFFGIGGDAGDGAETEPAQDGTSADPTHYGAGGGGGGGVANATSAANGGDGAPGWVGVYW